MTFATADDAVAELGDDTAHYEGTAGMEKSKQTTIDQLSMVHNGCPSHLRPRVRCWSRLSSSVSTCLGRRRVVHEHRRAQ
jgi:hypothetical protein